MPASAGRIHDAGMNRLLFLAIFVVGCKDPAPVKPPVQGEQPPAAPSAAGPVATDNDVGGASPTEAGRDQELDLQGHRGARALRPENTLPSLEYALDHEVDTLEFDLHFTKDKIPVVWHDALIRGSKCGLAKGASGPDPDKLPEGHKSLAIASMTWRELQAYRCDRNPDKERFPTQEAIPGPLSGGKYRIVALRDVFAFVERYAASESKTPTQRASARRVLFNVETKRKPDYPQYIGDGFDGVEPGAFEKAIAGDVERAGVAERFTLQSFDHRSLWAMHQLNHRVQLAALTKEAPEDKDFGRLASKGATIWSPDKDTVTKARVEAAHAAGLKVVPWTVNDEDEMKRLMAAGVDGLISDRPDLLVRVAR